ncbi:MAG: hypothetical protein ACI4EA_07235, partial [Candidatus Ornithomonoglobus sp.]
IIVMFFIAWLGIKIRYGKASSRFKRGLYHISLATEEINEKLGGVLQAKNIVFSDDSAVPGIPFAVVHNSGIYVVEYHKYYERADYTRQQRQLQKLVKITEADRYSIHFLNIYSKNKDNVNTGSDDIQIREYKKEMTAMLKTNNPVLTDEDVARIHTILKRCECRDWQEPGYVRGW